AEVEEARLQDLQAETAHAAERLRLRKELAVVRARWASAQERNEDEAACRRGIDKDTPYEHRPAHPKAPSPKNPLMETSGGASTHCAVMVARGEYVWRITGFSWLRVMLLQNEAPGSRDSVWSPTFHVGNETFQFVYNVDAEKQIWRDGPCGSLAIVPRTDNIFALRYGIHVPARTGEFVQWGETAMVSCDLESYDYEIAAYGPDVHSPGFRPVGTQLGIFGFSYDELRDSEWVREDTLTVKLVLEVRPEGDAQSEPLRSAVDVPGSTLSQAMLALLEEGRCSDVRFMMQDEVLQAHSPILCARSEVFSKQLTAGMQESISKVIVIEDCDVSTFKTFLQFLYTDCLPDVEELMPQTSTESEDEGSPRLLRMQALLAVSHKYEVKRLQVWCEAKISEEINELEVCSILCQAHLLQAKQLEKACLSFIKDHAGQVLTMPAYADLVKTWPQVALKVSLFAAGVSEADALAAFDASDTPPTRNPEPETL
ncbi:BPM1, partial [Symbiodinium microadriaticum]